MKVVLFCGGLGLRLRDFSDTIPKPMVPIGIRPIIWHLMKYYAHFGHKDFILCLGYRGDSFKKYFLTYDECESNDFTFSKGGRKLELQNSDIVDWRITFVDTGINTNIGQRMLAVKKYLTDQEVFLANYSDGLTDLNLDRQLEYFKSKKCVASFLSVKPNLTYHVVSNVNKTGFVKHLKPFHDTNIRINGGFFIFNSSIFDYINDGEDLVHEPFYRLIANNQLVSYKYDGFWAGMDTFKDKEMLEELYNHGHAPWEVWKQRKIVQ